MKKTETHPTIEPIACGLDDAAHALGISTASLRRHYINTGRLTVFKIGNRSVVKMADVRHIADTMVMADLKDQSAQDEANRRSTAGSSTAQ